MDLCDIDMQVRNMEPEIGHINFSDVKQQEKGVNHSVISATTFKGYPVIIFLQGKIVTNVVIE